MKESAKVVITHFFVITVAVLFFTTLVNTVDGVEECSIAYIWQVLITGVVSALPSCIFWSKKELSKKQWQIRFVFHFALIEAIIFTEGWIFEWYSDALSALVIAAEVILVYLIVYLYSYFVGISDAEKVNSALQAFNIDENDEKE